MFIIKAKSQRRAKCPAIGGQLYEFMKDNIIQPLKIIYKKNIVYI